MTPEIKLLPEKKLIGKHLTMSLAENKTYDLWHSFMPRRKDIQNQVNAELFSLQIFDPALDYKGFNEHTIFEKWAAVEVSDFHTIPAEMEALVLPGGLYAVFLHKGAAKTFEFIFGTWLPNAAFALDNTRPHFEILGEKYKNNDPNSEEDIWIPIRHKDKLATNQPDSQTLQ